jgi:hypothetical protein
MGPTGEYGATGEMGPTGEKGEQGETGPTGEMGYTGETGSTGEKGEQGEQGEQGETGPTGEKGEQGEQGATGYTGEKGEQGATGPTGSTGEKGEQGATGSTGEKGEQGEQGEIGSTGEKGEQGEQGATGYTGEMGPTGADSTVVGPTGEQGPTGEIGPTGQGFTPAYISVYSTQIQSIPLGAAINFEVVKEIRGFTVLSPSLIRADVDGIYFELKTIDTLEPNSCALYVNGVLETGTWFGANATAQDLGSAILTLRAGDTIEVRNQSSQGGTITLSPLGSGANPNVGQTTTGFSIFKIAELL